jgi:hypothetical protein
MPTAAALLLGVAGLAAAALFLFALSTYKNGDIFLACLIGFTAGLQGVQLGKVHAFTIACALYVVFGRRAVPGRVLRSLVLLGAVGCLVLSAPLGSFVNSETLAVQLCALALSAIVIATRATEHPRQQMLYGLLAATVLGAAVAIGQKAGVFPYTPVLDASGIARVKGIYHEPDWLGLYSAIGILIVFLIPLRRYIQIVCAACLVGGSVLSGARASWLALGIVALYAFVTHLARRYPDQGRLRNGRMLLLAAVIVPTIAVANPGIVSSLAKRLDGSQASQVSVVARQKQEATLEQLASSAPWHGLGLSAAGHVGVSGNIIVGPSPNNVATNWILGWWVDAKYLALPIILLLVGLAIRASTRPSGLLLGLVLIDSLFANSLLNPIAWFLVGVALSDLPAHVAAPARVRLSPPLPAPVALSTLSQRPSR